MLKNDTLKNGTSHIGLYGSAPESPLDLKFRYSAILLQHPMFGKNLKV